MGFISKLFGIESKEEQIKTARRRGITMQNMSMKQNQHKKPSTTFSFFQMVMILMMIVDALLIVVYVII